MIVCDIFEGTSEEDFGDFLESLTEQELKILASTFLMEVGMMQRLGGMFGGGQKPATKNAVNILTPPKKEVPKGPSKTANMMKSGGKAAGDLLGKLGKYAKTGAEMGAQGLKIIAQKGKEIAKDISYRLSQEGKNKAKMKKIEDMKKLDMLKANGEILDKVYQQHKIAADNNTNPDHAQAHFDRMAKTDPEMAGRFIAAFEISGSIRYAMQMAKGGLDQRKSDPYSHFDTPAKVSAPDGKLVNDPENIFSSLNVDEDEDEDDNFVYASDILFFDKDGKQIDDMDFDGYEDANTNHSEQELQAIAQKFNISSEDGKVVGYFDASDTIIDPTFQDDEEYPDGTIGVYIDSHSTEESMEEAELNDLRKRAGLEVEEGRMSDIHQAATEMDKEEFAKEYPEFEDDWESMQNHDDPNEPSQEEIDANYSIVKKYIGNKKDESFEESSEDSGEGPISSMSDEELMDYVGQREEDLIDDMQQHIAPDFLHKENFEEMFEKYREEVLEPAAEEISQDKGMDQMPDEMEMDAEESIDVDEAGCTPAHRKDKKKKEAVEDTADKALEAAMSELKKLAGLNEEDKKEFDEAGCMAEMKKLYASGCAKESMYSKLNAEYNCNRKQFEELYAHSCG